MYGNTNLYEMPALRTYQDALEHYESIKPIRGKDWLRPIINTPNGRRRQHMRIQANRAGSVACVLYDTKVLTYYPNDEIHFTNDGYATTTTHQFATALLNRWDRYGCSFSSHKGQTTATVGKQTVEVGPGEVLKLKYDRDTGFDFIDPPKMYAYYLKRAPMGMRRKEVAAFTTHAKALAKLVDPQQFLHGARHRFTASEFHEVMLSDDPEVWWPAIEQLLASCIRYDGDWFQVERKLTIPPAGVSAFIDDVIKYVHFDDLFERREVDKPNNNGNEKYLHGGGTYL